MNETILTLAVSLSAAGETERSLLELLCSAAEQEWSARLRDGMTAERCREAYVCACAFTAAAGLLEARCSGSPAVSFTAGDVSVRGAAAGETAAAVRGLRRQAERLMEPYAREDSFVFRGVRA